MFVKKKSMILLEYLDEDKDLDVLPNKKHEKSGISVGTLRKVYNRPKVMENIWYTIKR